MNRITLFILTALTAVVFGQSGFPAFPAYGNFLPSTGFSPTDISNLEYWAETDDVVVLGDKVTRWTDKSGNSYTVFAQSSDDSATYTAGVQNGQPAADFPGTQATYLASPQSTLLSRNAKGDQFTFVVVAKPETNGATDKIAVAGQIMPNVHFGFGDNTNFRAELQYNKASAIVARGSTNLQQQTYLFIAVHGFAADSLWLNGAAETVTYRAGAFSEAWSEPSAGDNWTLGSSYKGSGRDFNGKIYAVLLYSKAISAAERQKLQTYFNDKYAIY